MISGRVDKVELRFGLDVGLTRPSCGHPLVLFPRAGGIVPVNAADWTAASPGNWQAVGAGVGDFAAVAKSLRIPRRSKSDGPVTAIAIAPDSPLDSVDICIGSPSQGNYHRVAVGAPFIGVIAEDDDVLVAPSGALPTITRPSAIDAGGNQTTAWNKTTLLWDCYNPIGADGSQTEQTIPARLNVYRGSYPSSIIKRAPMEANLSWEVVQDIGGAVQAQPALICIVPGRRRWAVDAGLYDLGGQAGEAASVRIDVGTAKKTTGAAGLLSGDALDNIAWTNLVPATALTADIDGQSPFTFDYAGRPFFAVCVSIVNAAPAIVVRGYINLRAYDD